MTFSLWQSWTVRQLQQALQSQSPSLLEDLEHLIPALHRGRFNVMELYTRESLSRIVESFLPADAFRSKQFRLLCLNRLPPDRLASFARRILGESAPESFVEQRDRLAMKPWKGRFSDQFVEFFGLPEHFVPVSTEPRGDRVSVSPPTAASPTAITSAFKQLKDYQFAIYLDAIERLRAPRARFVVQMPTGSGKTRTAMEFICANLKESAQSSPVVVWLAHSQELCEQAFQCFLDVWRHLGNRPLTAARAWGEHPIPASTDGAMFVVAGFQKVHGARGEARQLLERLRSRCTLIVIDEAHKAIAPTFRDAVFSLKGEDSRIVGLTATPGRTFEKELEVLGEFFFNQRVAISSPEGTSVVSMLRERGVLSYAEFVPIITGTQVSLTPAQKRRLSSEFDFPPELIARLGQDSLRNLEISKRLIAECEAGRRVLLFACSVAHSKFLTSVLLYMGFRAGHVDGATPKNRRAGLIDGFRSGELNVLCNFGVLSTGFDAPNTDVVFITRPTASPVLYSQMIGRGLRGPAIGGTPRCTVIDVQDNIEGYGDEDRVYSLFDEVWA